MAVSKARVEFFMRKLKWLDAISVGVGKDHFTAHVAMVIGHHMNSDTGETFVGRETIADLIGGHVRTVEHSIQSLERLGFLVVRRARGRGHANTYIMAFPEKAASMPRFEPEKAASMPPFTIGGIPEEKAVSDHPKGGQNGPETRPPDRSNLIESNLKSLTLGNSEIEGTAVAAPNAPRPSSRSAIPPPRPRPMFQPIQPRPFNNRGEYELRLAAMITKTGGDGWAVLMSLDEVRVAALCRRLKNGVLTQAEINELCGPPRAGKAPRSTGLAPFQSAAAAAPASSADFTSQRHEA